ncbi:MAG: cytidine deaminase [bacterium]
MQKRQDELIAAAREVRRQSYSPYSKFRVGAALLASNGTVYTGTNVENASFGLSICAERSALFQAVAAGVREFDAIAIYADGTEPTPPCGACRQVLLEFAPKLTIWLAAANSAVEELTLDTLLARPFFCFQPNETED